MTNHYETIRAALEGARTTARICVLGGLAKETDDALIALAELERAAESRALYAAPPIPAPQPQAAVTDEMCELVSQLNDRLIESVHECYLLREALASTNAGLEPTPDQCVRIGKYAARVSDSTGNGASWQGNGRAIVAMVRDVMGGGE